jgi:APA family basic amino acid/polyamine antiporter
MMAAARPRPAPALAPWDADPSPTLRLRDALGIIVGTVIGAGIFRTPSLVAAYSGSEAVALLAWVLGGLISLVGALCYAELAAAYPHAGGDFHYLGRAWGQRLAFLFAWARLAVIQTGSVALLAFVVGDYASQLLGRGVSPAVYAGLVVVAFTVINVLGVRHGTATQNVLTAAEVGGLVLVIGAGLAVASPGPGANPAATAASPALGLVLVFVLLTYGGWNEAAYLSAEVRNPGRTMVRALVGGLLLVTALYVLVNWAFLHALGREGVAQSRAVAADLMQRVLGAPGATVVSLLVIVAALTSVNGAIFTGARTSWALGRTFPAFAGLGRWDGRAGNPVNAIVVQGAVALLLVGFGGLTRKGFETMVEYTAPVFWFFMTLTALALIVLRVREPGARRPFRVPLYPLTPLVFAATSAYLLYSSLAYTGIGALVGVAVLALGAVVMALGGSRRAERTSP